MYKIALRRNILYEAPTSRELTFPQFSQWNTETLVWHRVFRLTLCTLENQVLKINQILQVRDTSLREAPDFSSVPGTFKFFFSFWEKSLIPIPILYTTQRLNTNQRKFLRGKLKSTNLCQALRRQTHKIKLKISADCGQKKNQKKKSKKKTATYYINSELGCWKNTMEKTYPEKLRHMRS